jgi:putative ABC transport system substrate-binding protein
MIKRRTFIAGLGSAAAWPVVARAQQPAMPVVGFLVAGGPVRSTPSTPNAFAKGLNEMGYVEGRNVAFEVRWAENQPDRLPALAADLVRPRSGNRRRRHPRNAGGEGSDRDHTDRLYHWH